MKPQNYSLKFQNSLADSRITPGSQHGRIPASKDAPEARNGHRSQRKLTRYELSVLERSEMKKKKKRANRAALNSSSSAAAAVVKPAVDVDAEADFARVKGVKEKATAAATAAAVMSEFLCELGGGL